MDTRRLVAIPCYLGATGPYAFQRDAVAAIWWRAHLGPNARLWDHVGGPLDAVYVILTSALLVATVASVCRPRLAWAWLLLPLYWIWFTQGIIQQQGWRA